MKKTSLLHQQSRYDQMITESYRPGILVHEVPGLFMSYGISVFGVWEILTKKNAEKMNIYKN